ncbi:cysteine hydrolase family protein [Treponema primitia]|uniref:cysteine hydrolase family protein n=1 Tax=Treponema primitia TaxID=88058 RepID=UPI000255539B|nr:isochorismatase family cysteine hydrolase [Treponema primitia]
MLPTKFIDKAVPYPWPYDGNLKRENTALLVIDMQADFVAPGGYIDHMGYDVSLTARAIKPIRKVLDAARAIPGLMIIHTREGHRPDLSDLPANKRWRSALHGIPIGEAGPKGRILVRGEEGWDIVEELCPQAGELIIDKPGKSAFYATDLEVILRCRGIVNLILTGVTTDCCVHSTLRDANDRGFECVTLSDCTGATVYENHLAALSSIQQSNGLFGCVSDSDAVIEVLEKI